MGDSDELHVGEHHPGAQHAVVEEHLETGRGELRVERLHGVAKAV